MFSRGFRYRKNVQKLPGSPDIVLPKYRATVFVNGCFWHGHDSCKAATLPKTNTAFWKRKISENRIRDRKNEEELKEDNWRVLVVWQCEITRKNQRQRRLRSLVEDIKKVR